ncbi:hypothetical protein EDC02_2551 [Micromonospora sp. Llam0]|nr:hypothetical protein EDC02_2551 [Micromonospora sp. Llam0]
MPLDRAEIGLPGSVRGTLSGFDALGPCVEPAVPGLIAGVGGPRGRYPGVDLTRQRVQGRRRDAVDKRGQRRWQVAAGGERLVDRRRPVGGCRDEVLPALPAPQNAAADLGDVAGPRSWPTMPSGRRASYVNLQSARGGCAEIVYDGADPAPRPPGTSRASPQAPTPSRTPNAWRKRVLLPVGEGTGTKLDHGPRCLPAFRPTVPAVVRRGRGRLGSGVGMKAPMSCSRSRRRGDVMAGPAGSTPLRAGSDVRLAGADDHLLRRVCRACTAAELSPTHDRWNSTRTGVRGWIELQLHDRPARGTGACAAYPTVRTCQRQDHHLTTSITPNTNALCRSTRTWASQKPTRCGRGFPPWTTATVGTRQCADARTIARLNHCGTRITSKMREPDIL